MAKQLKYKYLFDCETLKTKERRLRKYKYKVAKKNQISINLIYERSNYNSTKVYFIIFFNIFQILKNFQLTNMISTQKTRKEIKTPPEIYFIEL